MDEPGPPPTLIQHTCKPHPIPPGGGTVGERERLRAALTWSYEYDLLVYEVWSAFTSAVHIQHPESSGPVPQLRFEVKEDALGIERTVLLRRTEGEISLEDVEIIPLDHDSRGELAFKLLESSPEQRCIRYPGGPESSFYRLWRIRIDGLNAVRNPTALAEAQTGEWAPVRFNEPVTARVEVADEFRIDLLSTADGERRGPLEQLVELFSLICDGVRPDTTTFKIGCEYSYPLDVTGIENTIPVLQATVEPHDVRRLAKDIIDNMRSWHSSVSPPAGKFIMRFQIDGRDAEGILFPRVEFSQLLMPSAFVGEV